MRRRRSCRLLLPRLLLPGLLLLSLAACGTAASLAPSPSAAAGTAGPATLPWELPPSALGTQGLYRVSLSGPDDSGSFRLSLLLESAQRYQVRAVDPLGRALWTLDVDGEEGLWLDHRNRLRCPLEGSFDLAAARLAPFPLAALPSLLLGRLPAAPAPGERAARRPPGTDDRLDYRDDRGRRWTARLEDGRPAAWTLWRDGSPALWWVLRGEEAYLSDPGRGNQLRWRRTLGEPLAGALEDPAVPDGYRTADCAVLYG